MENDIEVRAVSHMRHITFDKVFLASYDAIIRMSRKERSL